jgi:hypothetical protein
MKKFAIILSILGFLIGTGFLNAFAYVYFVNCTGATPISFPVWV